MNDVAIIDAGTLGVSYATQLMNLIFVPLIVGTIWLGLYPNAVLDYTGPTVEALTTAYRAAIGG